MPAAKGSGWDFHLTLSNPHDPGGDMPVITMRVRWEDPDAKKEPPAAGPAEQ